MVGHGLDFLAYFVLLSVEWLAPGLCLEDPFADPVDAQPLQEPALPIIKVENLPEKVDKKILQAVPFRQDPTRLARLDAAEVGDDVEDGKGGIGKKVFFACAPDYKPQVCRVIEGMVRLHKIILETPARACQRRMTSFAFLS